MTDWLPEGDFQCYFEAVYSDNSFKGYEFRIATRGKRWLITVAYNSQEKLN